MPGAGTTFTIKIPLTLAIVSALIVEAGTNASPSAISVVELVRAQKEAGHGHNEAGSETVIERINDTPVLRLRDRLLPLVNLNDLLALGEFDRTTTPAPISWSPRWRQQPGIIVDRVFDTEEIVVKPVAPILRHVTMFSGNTILGDGSVIMILDPNGIARGTGIGAGGDGKAISSTRSMRRSTIARRCCCSAPAATRSWRCRSGLWRAGGHSARQDRNLRWRAGHAYRGKLMPLVALSRQSGRREAAAAGTGVQRRRPQHGPDGR